MSASLKRAFTPDPPPLPKRLRPSASPPFPQDSLWPDSPVHLPPIFSSAHDLRRASLPTLYSENIAASRVSGRLSRQSGLSSYQFPPSEMSSNDDRFRPRLDTQLSTYNNNAVGYGYSSSSYPNTSNSSFSFSPHLSNSNANYHNNNHLTAADWSSAPPIVRPNSSPGSDRSHVKSEIDPWSFSAGGDGSPEFPEPLLSVVAPSATSAVKQPPALISSLPSPAAAMAERPKGKRGKLPKPVTDYLKDWLHRHSDHPYPSEDEKKQLCEATGLSMSQVSNWMINARRRILVPAQRAQSISTNGPVKSASPVTSSLSNQQQHPSRSSSNLSHQHFHPSSYRRASVPTSSPDLQIYYPMTLQSIPTPAASLQHSQSLSNNSHTRLNSGLSSADLHHSLGSFGNGHYLGRNTNNNDDLYNSIAHERDSYGGAFDHGGSSSSPSAFNSASRYSTH